jgi:hypothetical protein
MVPFYGCAGWSYHLAQGGYVASYPPAMTLLFFREIPVDVYMSSAGEKSQEINAIIQWEC